MPTERQTALVPLHRETILPSSDRGRLAAIVATCSLAGLAGGMALSMLAETHRATQVTRDRAHPGHARAPLPADTAWLGVTLREVSPRCDGARVVEVVARSPAAAIGLRRDDRIVSYGGDAVCGRDQLIDVVRASAIGAQPALGVRRGAEEFVLRPTLAQMPAPIRAEAARERR
jgi:S1-C subfamily serine protease